MHQVFQVNEPCEDFVTSVIRSRHDGSCKPYVESVRVARNYQKSSRSSTSSNSSSSSSSSKTSTSKCLCWQKARQQVLNRLQPEIIGCCCCSCKDFQVKQCSSSCSSQRKQLVSSNCACHSSSQRSRCSGSQTSNRHSDGAMESEDSIKIVIVNGPSESFCGGIGGSKRRPQQQQVDELEKSELYLAAGKVVTRPKTISCKGSACGNSALRTKSSSSSSSCSSIVSSSIKETNLIGRQESSASRCLVHGYKQYHKSTCEQSRSLEHDGGKEVIMANRKPTSAEQTTGASDYISNSGSPNGMQQVATSCDVALKQTFAAGCNQSNAKHITANAATRKATKISTKVEDWNNNRATGESPSRWINSSRNGSLAVCNDEPNESLSESSSKRIESCARFKLANLFGNQRTDEVIYEQLGCHMNSPRSSGSSTCGISPQVSDGVKRFISRSGSQCSSISSTSTASSSALSISSGVSGYSVGSRQLNHSPPLIEESESESRIESVRKLVQKVVIDENNNNCEDLYSKTTTLSSSVPPPPPPPPPPLQPLLPLSLNRTLSASVNDTVEMSNDSSKNLINNMNKRENSRVMEIPAFIPPQFSTPPEDGTNIKPSEYLKRVSSNSALAQVCSNQSSSSTPIGSLSSSTGASLISRSGTSSSSGSRKFERSPNVQASVNRFRQGYKPAQASLIRSQSTSALSTIESEMDSKSNISNISSPLQQDSQIEESTPSRSLNADLMSAIRSFDRAKSLKITKEENERKQNLKDMLPLVNGNRDALIAATKRDLIAELKESRGLDGIKRMKETCMNKDEMKQTVSSLVPSFKAEDFLDKVAESEPEAPLWRRQMLAKKAAERARKECEEKLRIELEEQRMSRVPAWKRQMLAKKAAERCKRDDANKIRQDIEERQLDEIPAWRRQLVRSKLAASTGNVSEVGMSSAY